MTSLKDSPLPLYVLGKQIEVTLRKKIKIFEKTHPSEKDFLYFYN